MIFEGLLRMKLGWNNEIKLEIRWISSEQVRSSA